MHAGDRVRTHMEKVMEARMAEDAVAHERVETAGKDACPLRGASECGQEDVRKLAGRVRRRACGRAKECCPVCDCSVDANTPAIGSLPRRKQMRHRWQTACKSGSLGRSNSIQRPVVAVCCAAVAESQPLSARCRRSLTSCIERCGARFVTIERSAAGARAAGGANDGITTARGPTEVRG